MHDDTNLDRRTFLKRSAAVPLGVAGWTAQDESESARVTRRMAFRRTPKLGENYRRKILLLTDRTTRDPDVSEVEGCSFSDWPTDALTIWEGIVFDWKNAAGTVGFYGDNPTVKAQAKVKRNTIYVDEKDTPVPLGTAYIVGGVVDCPGEFVGVTPSQIPGVQIKTPSDEAGGTEDISLSRSEDGA